jgi:archaeal preflagellin peptidase FlaK
MTGVEFYLDITRLLVGIFILGYASYTDIKTRHASNMNWFIMGLFGVVLLLLQYITVGIENPMILIFIPIMIGLVYLFFQLRLIFGGADAKALMAIAILLPLQPSINQFPLLGQSYMPAAWTVFSNSVILFMFIPLGLLFYNILKRNIKLPHVLLGYKMQIKDAREKFVWPLEKIVDGKTKFSYMPKDFDAAEEYDEFEKEGIKDIWVTPKIPFMIPLLGGFIFTFVFGDMMFYFMQMLM